MSKVAWDLCVPLLPLNKLYELDVLKFLNSSREISLNKLISASVNKGFFEETVSISMTVVGEVPECDDEGFVL